MSREAEPRAHLWHLDMIRVIAFMAVIAVHSIAFTEQPANEVAAGALMLLQFGREVFFALTAFVLTVLRRWPAAQAPSVLAPASGVCARPVRGRGRSCITPPTGARPTVGC